MRCFSKTSIILLESSWQSFIDDSPLISFTSVFNSLPPFFEGNSRSTCTSASCLLSSIMLGLCRSRVRSIILSISNWILWMFSAKNPGYHISNLTIEWLVLIDLLRCFSYSVAGNDPLKPTRMWQWMQTKESAVGADFRPTGLDFFLPTIFLFRNTNYKKKCYFFETYESILQATTFKAYDFSFFSSVFYCLFGFSVKRLRSFILSPSLMYTYSQIRAYSVHRNFVSRFHLTVPWLNIFINLSRSDKIQFLNSNNL